MKNADIKDRLADFYDAFNNKKWKVVEEYLSEDFSYFTDNCRVQKKSDFISFMQSDDWQGESFQLEELKIGRSESDDLAFATCRTKFEGIASGTKMKFQAIETVVFKAEAGEWKILHFHVSNKV